MADEDGESTGSNSPKFYEDPLFEILKSSEVKFQQKSVGTMVTKLGHPEVYIRGFVPTALAYLMRTDPAPEMVLNFLETTVGFQGRPKVPLLDGDHNNAAFMLVPTCFRVDNNNSEYMLFDSVTSGRTISVDSCFWWIILLRSYIMLTEDRNLSNNTKMRKGIKSIMKICLSESLSDSPAFLCEDGCSMIDRRMGIYGYPLDVQTLFFFALRCAFEILSNHEGRYSEDDREDQKLLVDIENRMHGLQTYLRRHYWIDEGRLPTICSYQTDTDQNKFNVNPASVPTWIHSSVSGGGGYFIGNVSLGRMDFRWFLMGNCLAILSSLATPEQATAIMTFIDHSWNDIVGEMPLKMVYPPLLDLEWSLLTGSDTRNMSWMYQNGGSWPGLLWLLSAASIKAGNPDIARRAIEKVKDRLERDKWPEYYDGMNAQDVGKEAKIYCTSTISGYLVAEMMVKDNTKVEKICFGQLE